MEKEKKGGFNKFIFGVDLKKFMFLMAQTFAVFIAIICLNFFGIFLKNKFDLKLDLWPGGVSSLSFQARSYLRNYDKSKKIKFVFLEPGGYNYASADEKSNVFNEVGRAVAAANPNFKSETMSMKDKNAEEYLKKVSMVDYVQPEQEESYGPDPSLLIVDETDPSNLVGIVLSASVFEKSHCETFEEHLKIRSAMATHRNKPVYDDYRKVGSHAFAYERAFVGALEKLSGKKMIRVAATVGHGEHDFSRGEGVLNSIGARLEKCSLEKSELSPEKQLLLISAPKKDFSKEELDKIDAFLNGGGKMVYLASASQKSLENLDQFLKSHGIEFSEGFVVNFSGKDGKPSAVMGLDLNKQKNAYTEKMVEKKWPLVLSACRPMVLNGSAVQDGWKLFEVCRTPAKCVAATGESTKNMAELKNKATSEYVVVGGSQKELGQGKVAKIVAVATERLSNGLFLSDRSTALSRCLTSNSNFVYSLLKETSGQGVIDYLPTKFMNLSSSVSQHNGVDGKPLTEEQSRLKSKILGVVMIGLPCVFLLISFIIGIIRRRRK